MSQKPDTADFTKALEIVRSEGKCTVAMLQSRLRLGFQKAASMVKALEDAGVIAPKDLDGQHAVLPSGDEILPINREAEHPDAPHAQTGVMPPAASPESPASLDATGPLEGSVSPAAAPDEKSTIRALKGVTVHLDPKRIYVGANVRTTFPEAEMVELREGFRAQGFQEEISRLLVRALEYRWMPEVTERDGHANTVHFLIEWKRNGEWVPVWETFQVPADAPWRLLEIEEDVQAALAWLPVAELVLGGRRHRASLDVGLETVPCVLREMDDIEMLDVQLIENLQRQGLTPLDEGLAYKRRLEMRPEPVLQLARRLGIPRVTVDTRLAMASLVGSAAEKPIVNGTLGVGHAMVLARIAPGVLDEVLDLVLRPKTGPGPMSVRDLETLIADNYQKELRSAKFDSTDPTLLPEAGACSDCKWNSSVIARLRCEPQPRVHMCTNTACFRQKEAADETRWRRLQEAAGKKVIAPEKAEALWNHRGDLLPNSGYVDLGETPYPHELKDQDKTAPAWKTLVRGKEVPVELVRDKKGKVHELVPREAAVVAAVENKHDIFKQTHAESVGAQEEQKPTDAIDAAAKELEAERKRKEDERVAREQEAVWSAQLAAVRLQLQDRPELPEGAMLVLWDAIYDPFIDGVSVAAGERHMESEAFEKAVEKGNNRFVLAAIFEVILAEHWWNNGGAEEGVAAKMMERLAKLLGVKLSAIAKEAKAAFAKTLAAEDEASSIETGMKWLTKRTKASDFEWDGGECVDPDVLELAMPDDSPVTCSVRVGRSSKGWFFGNWHCLRNAVGGATRAVRETPPEYGTRELAAAAGVRDLIEEFAQFENYAATVTRLKAYLTVITSAKKGAGK